MLFDRDFLGTPVKPTFIFQKVPGRTFLFNLSKIITLAAAVDPICPQPTGAHHDLEAPGGDNTTATAILYSYYI